MAAPNNCIPHLDVRSHNDFNTSNGRNSTNCSSSSDSSGGKHSRILIAQLQLATVQSIRITNVVLGCFSLALAFIVIHRIVSDAKRAAALRVLPRRQRFASLHNIHTAELFPLVLACSAVLELAFIIPAQSTTLHTIYSMQGKLMAILTLPTIFLVGYTTLVFGFEMAWRAVRHEKFAPRGRWNTAICIGIVSFLVVLTLIPSVASPTPARNFGGLIFFSAMRYSLFSLIVMSLLVGLLLLLAVVIAVQLMRTEEMDPNERISASRMTFFLIVAAVDYALVIPLEGFSYRNDTANMVPSGVIAEVSLFSIGIAISFVHLFLRANVTRMVIRPLNEMNAIRQPEPRIRLFGPSGLQMNISGPMTIQTDRRLESTQNLISFDLEHNHSDTASFERALTPISVNSLGSIDPTKWPLPPDDEKDMGSGSLFPTRVKDVPRFPAPAYNPNAAQESLEKSNFGIRRFTSTNSVTNVSDLLIKPQRTDSIATVQIGLRFSLGPAAVAAPKGMWVESPVLPPEQHDGESSEESLALPVQSPSLETIDSVYSQAQQERIVPLPLFSNPDITTNQPPLSSSTSTPGLLAPTAPVQPALHALRMTPLAANPPTPPISPGMPQPGSPASIVSATSMTPSPRARIPLGAGTMSRGSRG